MARFHITLHRTVLATGLTLPIRPGDHTAIWVISGTLGLGETQLAAGEGGYVTGPVTATTTCKLLRFAISTEAAETPLLRAGFDWDGPGILRLDQVSFPPGARAYRHVHPGPGIRFLVEGALEILSDHDCAMMAPGDAWYEDAFSPVQATAGDQPTRFVRAMVLPPEFHGQPTLQLLNDADRDKPRLQTNTRFFDQPITL